MNYKFISIMSAACLFTLTSFAQETGQGNPNSIWKTEELFQPLALAMMSIILLLLFAIIALTRVVSQSSKIARLKIFTEKKSKKIPAILLPLMLLSSLSAFAQEAAPSSNMIGGISETSFYILFIIIILEVIVVIMLGRAFKYTMTAELEDAKVVKSKEKTVSWWDRINNTKSTDAAKEQEINTGHNYDGIEELDNPPPPWWQWGFALSAVFAIVYMWVYHVSHSAPNQIEEYEIAKAKADQEVAKYLETAGNNVDENTVVYSTEEADLSAGLQIYNSKCVACHAADGGGSIGPNLVDDSWLHGCSINDIFKVVKYGVPDKGMVPWKDQLSPKQIAQVASYVKSIQGNKAAAPKEPQGELCTDEPVAEPKEGEGASDVEDTAEGDPVEKEVAFK